MKNELHTVQSFEKIIFRDFSNIENYEMKALSSNSFLTITTLSGKVINLICEGWRNTPRVIIGHNWIMYGAAWKEKKDS